MSLIYKFLDKKEKALVVFVLAMTLLQVILDSSIPVQTKKITTLLKSTDVTISSISQAGAIMLALALAAFACAIVVGYCIAKVGTSVGTKIRDSIFSRILKYSLPEIGKFGVGSLITRCTDDINSIQTFITNSVKPLVQAPLLTIIVVTRISDLYSVWTAITIIVVAVIVGMVIYIFAVAVPAVKGQYSYRDKLVRESNEHISGIRVVQAYNAQEYQASRFKLFNSEMTKYATISDKALSTFMPFTVVMLYVMTMAVYITGAFHIQVVDVANRVELFGDMTAFIFYVALLITSVLSIVQVVLMFPSTMNSIKRISQVLNCNETITDKDNATDIEYAGGTIELKNVSFKYPESDENAITDISFRVEKGETFAIIGNTGCGKTTLLNLIMRLYEVTDGEVLIDGVNIKDYRLMDLRNRIGYVPQTSFLFAGTVDENIGYGENGRLKASFDAIVEAAKVGQADEFISQKEGGYHSEVSSGGSNFSGGQRQRLAISRAICRDPEIYIFDDSFSALDFKTDKILRKKLKEYAKDKTTIIVGQRISTVRDADTILVMNRGKVAGIGTHNELMESCDLYKEIALSQMSNEEAMR